MDDSLKGYYNHFLESLLTIYDKEEAVAIAHMAFEDKLLVKPHHIMILDKHMLISELQMMEDILSRLMKHEPLQYVLGTCEFCRLEFKVNRHVLIPRRETEELVETVLHDLAKIRKGKITLLDIGTGSGCIAISIKKKRPDVHVVALDISSDALLVARENANQHHTDIEFIQADILSVEPGLMKRFDVIISNPPYIMEEEKAEMQKNVLWHEPHQALFVPDHDPLQFYRAIARVAGSKLEPDGKLYMEINEAFPQEMRELLIAHSFHDIVLWNDMQGKTRFIKGSR